MLNIDNKYFKQLQNSKYQPFNQLSSKERMLLSLMSVALTSPPSTLSCPPNFVAVLSKQTSPQLNSPTVTKWFNKILNLIPIDNHFSLKYPAVTACSPQMKLKIISQEIFDNILKFVIVILNYLTRAQ